MRTSILSAAILGLFAAGCAGDLSGTGDDQQIPETCGNGAVDVGETCDDSNNTNGDGCSAACQTEQSATPKLNVAVDKPTVNTELNTDTMITVTLTGEGGFGEAVNLSGTVVDPAGATLPWTVTFNSASVTLPTNGTATAIATVHIPSERNGSLIGTLKVTASSSLPAVTVESQFTALEQISINVLNNGGQCVYPDIKTVQVKVGTKVRFVNKFATQTTIVIHSGGPIAHESDPPTGGNLPNGAYERTVTAPGTATWYCHSPGPNPTQDADPTNDPKVVVVQ